MTPLERHCRWLLHTYPTWYRRDRAAEMLGTLLEASPPGRKWPSFRDARSLVIGGLRVRGWTRLLSMLWVAAATVNAGDFFYVTTKPFSWADVNSEMQGPVAVQIAVDLASIAWLALPLPVLIGGFIRLRGWRRGNWLRAAAWASAWLAGAALMAQANVWGQYPEQSCPNMYSQNGLVCPIPSPAVVSWGELAICTAWLVLGAVMARMLTGPARGWNVPDTSRKASPWPPSAGDLQP